MPDTIALGAVGKAARDALKPLKVKMLIVFTLVMGLLTQVVSAAGICWTTIHEIMSGISTYLLPDLVDIVIAAVPLWITLAVVGFIMMFLYAIAKKVGGHKF